ncbi:LRR receptor-like serine/threonine-protein kinase GSO2 [Vigna radiata var. radiata]|uniref:LRR receptor-like serine/threonine-protein kinase GSO2 n=1 Tax=Vigna radiata var. radiata TaxID=3916 RepID=A0A1S3U5N7_VIGRR|nr:LRR receptor-like serine/threonine-protein kinase GSO2 [Vigna radiata var. radiata]
MARNSAEWADAMQIKIKALQENGTWFLTKLPPGKKSIRCRWVYKIKHKVDGTVERPVDNGNSMSEITHIKALLHHQFQIKDLGELKYLLGFEWLHYILQDLQVQPNATEVLYCDNNSARHIAHNQSFDERTKHIKLDCHVVREKIQAKFLRLLPIRSEEQLFDVFTKFPHLSEVVNGEEEITCIPEEREALLQFKDGIVDDHGMLSSWTTPHCCQWEGIRCSNLTSHIISLDLHGDGERYMSGEIHMSLMELPQLQYLNLSSNSFPDTHIPDFLASLKNLKYLDLSLEISPNCSIFISHLYLSLNGFEGNIPSQLGNLSQLHELYLVGYDGNLKISDGGQWLSNLISLTHLYLDSVSNLNRSHTWLQGIAKLPQVKELSLTNCSLSDDFILSSKFNFSTSLSVLHLSHNTFTSIVFQWLSNITSDLVDLDLSANLLEGSTLIDFGIVMNSLRHLDLSSNNLTEDLPSILGNLSSGCVRQSLQELDLSWNHITGTLSDISIFSSLKSLFLRGNQLSGRIPEGVKLPSTLEYFLISSNSLQGGIPKSFGDACSLCYLDMSFNSLSDELPMIISHLSGCARYSLQQLYLHDNQINGTLPDFSTFTSLQTLDLSENKLNGEIPMDIQFPPKLETLYMYSNSLKGVLTDYHFANMSKLQNLYLSDNSLGFAFTQNWVPSFQLLSIYLRSCQLGPTFPTWLQTQNKFVEIDISNATISGIIPEWFWAKLPLQKVMKMNISYNSLQGTIPNVSSTYVSSSIHLGSNRFEGSIPLFLRNSKILDLSKNKFSNPLLFLCGGDANSVQIHLDISYNQLYGDIPDCWKQMNSLVYLDLSYNNFSGKIPTSMGWLLGLQVLLLRNNNLVGGIPFSIRNCTKLVMFDLSENRLSGSIPDWIGTKKELQILSLRKNQFFGSLPLMVCCLRRLHLLDLSQNNLSGKIPKCINNLTSMAQTTSSIFDESHWYTLEIGLSITTIFYYLNAWLTWKGSKQMFMDKGLSLLKIIDLSSNQFSEEIPIEIEKLSGLISLNLSRNSLIGKIPSNIGNITSLDSLDLSRNRLVGSIPLSLAQIYRLGVLDLSHNQLSGEIPTSTQLQSFNKSSYEDNLDLCGPPLEKLCIDEELTKKPNVNVYKDEYSFFNNEFFISMAIGFALSFWMVFGSILFIRSWRWSYFNFLNNLEDNVHVKIAIVRVFKHDRDYQAPETHRLARLHL